MDSVRMSRDSSIVNRESRRMWACIVVETSEYHYPTSLSFCCGVLNVMALTSNVLAMLVVSALYSYVCGGNDKVQRLCEEMNACENPLCCESFLDMQCSSQCHETLTVAN